jgi:hypothetical protein
MVGYLILCATALYGYFSAPWWWTLPCGALLFVSPVLDKRPFMLSKLPYGIALRFHGMRIVTSGLAVGASFLLGHGTAWLSAL